MYKQYSRLVITCMSGLLLAPDTGSSNSSSSSSSSMQLNKHDPLGDAQAWLWHQLGVPTAPSKSQWQQLDLAICVAAARVVCLRQVELQRLSSPQDLHKPLNPRNEAAALALLLTHQHTVCGTDPSRCQQLQQLLAAYPEGLCSPGRNGRDSGRTQDAAAPQQLLQQQQQQQQAFSDGTPEEALQRWVLGQGASSNIFPALFEASSSSNGSGGCGSNGSSGAAAAAAAALLRGCAAAHDLEQGSVVVSLPEKLLITYKTAAESEFGKALSRIPGLDPETLAVIWTLVDRHDPDSPFAPFWSALPGHFGTALSAPQPLVDLMKGLPVYQETVAARDHIRQQFTALQQTFKVLLTAYAAHLQACWFSEEAYLWAVELWYAYAIQVKFPDGTIQPALAPFVSLINHSPWPHIVHFSTINPKTHCLDLTCFRPVRQGQQVFMSYGPLPNSQLLLFYGFAVQDNPFEELQLEIRADQVLAMLQQQQQTAPAAASAGSVGAKEAAGHAVAAKMQLLGQLGLLQQGFTLTMQQPLPPGLLPCVRLLCASEAELKQLQQALQQHETLHRANAEPGDVGAADKGSRSLTGKGIHAKSKAASTGSSSSSSSSGSKAKTSQHDASVAELLQRRWATVAKQEAVLGSPISSQNEAAAVGMLRQLLTELRQPLEACVTKVQRRQQLQKLLKDKQQLQPGEQDFMSVVQVYVNGLLQVVDGCAAAVQVPP